MDSYEGWKALGSRIDAWPGDRQAAFALACAQGAVGPDVGLLGSLHSGWDVLLDRGDVTQVLTDLERYQDLDDDAVAATFYALSSVNGQSGAAWWAASRTMDQAFACVEYPDDAVAFHPVEADALSAVVQFEIGRQLRLLEVAESACDLTAAVGQLRSDEKLVSAHGLRQMRTSRSGHLSTSTLYVSVTGPPDSANGRSGSPVDVGASDPMDRHVAAGGHSDSPASWYRARRARPRRWLYG